MSYEAELPQTPRAKRFARCEASPSSSSGNSIVEETEAWEAATSLLRKNVIFSHEGGLAPSSVDPRNGDVKGKHDASSPFDPRRLSSSPLLYAQPDQAYLCTAPLNGYDTLIIKKNLAKKMYHFWISNRSYLLVIISTFFGSLMTLLTKLLESDGHGMHAFQILVLRMAVSWVVCVASVYYTKRCEFPFGPKDVRWLLVMRGVFGFVGIGGLWTGLSEFTDLESLVLRAYPEADA